MFRPPSRPVGARASVRTVAATFAALQAGLIATALLPAPADAQSLRGSRASIERMHAQALGHGLRFYETASGAQQAARQGKFRRLAGNGDYRVHMVSFPYVTDETALFVERLAAQYRATCGEVMVVTSALRPESRQPANSADLSVHPTGMAVDLRKPTKAKCLTFLRTTLLELEDEGVLEATEERRPPHFHVAVFPRPYARYVGGTPLRLASGVATSPAPVDEDAVAEAMLTAARVATRPAAVRTAAKAAPKPAARRAAPRVTRHRVRSGDTLWHLARRYGTTVKKLRTTNQLASSALKPGQQLLIPRG